MVKQNRVSTNSSETAPSSRRHFLAMMGKGAALAGLGIFGAGSDAATKRSCLAEDSFPLHGERLNKIYSQAGYARPLRAAL